MSDKHTDAQGELTELPTAQQYVRVWFSTEAEKESLQNASQEYFTADQMRDYALAALARRASQVSEAGQLPPLGIDVFRIKGFTEKQMREFGEQRYLAGVGIAKADLAAQLARATEGQAQTSAAIHVLHSPAEPLWNEQREQLQAKVVESALDLAEHTGCMGFSVPISGTTPQLSVSLAAQLADSTAPGAPLDEDKLEREYFERWPDTAPTAQQSLTAGGAVPEGEPMPCPCCGADALMQEQEPHRHSQCIAAFLPDHEGSFTVECSVCACAMIANTAAEVLAMWNRRAAAPLPQVQSEALDEDPIECWSADQEDFNATELDSVLTMHEELKPGDTVWVGEAVRPEPSQLIDADDILTTMGERAHDIAGEHAEDYPDVSKEAEQELNTLLAAWIGKHASPSFWTVANIRPYVLSHDDFPSDPTPVHCEFAVDQQPVTPSGALADNDGGVV